MAAMMTAGVTGNLVGPLLGGPCRDGLATESPFSSPVF